MMFLIKTLRKFSSLSLGLPELQTMPSPRAPPGGARRRNACFITAFPRRVQLHREPERAERPLDPRRDLYGAAPPRRWVDQHNNGCAHG